MKVTKATSRGQITLPKKWRSQFMTDHYILEENEKGMMIIPIGKKKQSGSESTWQDDDYQEGDEVIFNADRDNNGEGVDSQYLIDIMEDILREKA